MVRKYRVVCKACNHVMGVFDKPDIECPLVCDECGEHKVAVEGFDSTEVEQLTFDVLITNTKTNASKRCGFFISKEVVEKNRKNLNKMRAILAEELASSIHMIVSSDVLLVELLKQGDE